ncbi:probable DNA-directed RNA polymerase III subunit RPC6 [Trichogramma pretiosum]|uniref:probable DNA-directed RNA polymerase III subunit RPC6 n=1 Tax=Trichogramma pretiosum TaxID=7493 RepID=UPI0006C991B3|nr:probable DNA-directed RNA polymerase III subunit RPC6 [Trichogramma pretiosum]
MEVNSDTQPTQGLDETRKKVIALAQSKPKGILDEDVATIIPEIKQRVVIINDLLHKKFLTLFTLVNGKFLYKYREPVVGVKVADDQEKLVYELIEKAGNKGIWIREIRQKLNLTQAQTTKVLKSLEKKRIIKAIKPVGDSKKNFVMLYHLEPPSSVTGGAWYQDQEFEGEFVNVLNEQCYRYLEKKREKAIKEDLGPIAEKNGSFAPSTDVLKYISELGISKVKLKLEDLEMILHTLIYDGKVEKITTSNGNNMYRAVQPLVGFTGLMTSPCGVCPVRKDCSDIGTITPLTCQYFSDWLS